MQFINAAISPDAQAAVANKIALAPANPDAAPKISKKSNDLMASGHVDQSAGYINNEYWGENYDSILEKFNAVVVT
jgi:hypothetical protein